MPRFSKGNPLGVNIYNLKKKHNIFLILDRYFRHIYSPQKNLQKGNIFRYVCLSVNNSVRFVSICFCTELKKTEMFLCGNTMFIKIQTLQVFTKVTIESNTFLTVNTLCSLFVGCRWVRDFKDVFYSLFNAQLKVIRAHNTSK